SPWAATHIVDPDNLLSLDVYAAVTSLGRPDFLLLEDFIRYGDWFQRTALPDLDTRHVATIEPASRGFSLALAAGTTAHARRAVGPAALPALERRSHRHTGPPCRRGNGPRHPEIPPARIRRPADRHRQPHRRPRRSRPVRRPACRRRRPRPERDRVGGAARRN